jgi:hypothetical protein
LIPKLDDLPYFKTSGELKASIGDSYGMASFIFKDFWLGFLIIALSNISLNHFTLSTFDLWLSEIPDFKSKLRIPWHQFLNSTAYKSTFNFFILQMNSIAVSLRGSISQ